MPDVSLLYQSGRKKNLRSDQSGQQNFQTEKIRTLSINQPLFNGFRGLLGLKQGRVDYLAYK